MDKPKLRKVFPGNAAKGAPKPFVLDDPFGLVPEPVFVTEQELRLARLMDGRRTLEEIAAAHAAEHGGTAAPAQIRALAVRLDDNLLLDGPRFREAWTREEEAYRAGRIRSMRHAGEGYPPDPGAFRAALSSWRDEAGLAAGAVDTERVPGLFAPHIDISLAGPAYAAAWAPAAADPRNETFVILGTAHYRDVNLFILTEKDFETPFGTVPVDRDFIEELKGAFGADLFRDELIQKVEHSVEFQAVFLDALLSGVRPFRIVPILVSSFAGAVDEGAVPADNPLIADFIAALDEVLELRRDSTCVAAGVDLAHVGRKFGDDFVPTEQTLKDIEAADRETLSYCCALDADGFWQDAMGDGNARKVCGLAPMYVASRVLRAGRGEIASWGRDFRPDDGYVVTYAGVVFRGEGGFFAAKR